VLSYASAGHPPGSLAHPDGRIGLLDQGQSLALGLRPERPRGAATTQVPLGARLLLYTDRLVERRDLDIDVTTGRAATLLGPGRDTPVTDLAEQLMTGLAPAQGYEDDVALLLYSRPVPLDLAFPADPDELAVIRRQLRG
jgi:serine phosphatase RsbU (regulator of sigma subunit)